LINGVVTKEMKNGIEIRGQIYALLTRYSGFSKSQSLKNISEFISRGI